MVMAIKTKITVKRGDITKEKVDAIVNAANHTLLGGGGVDGAIHRAAGPELLAECRTLGGCATGEAKITKGYRLPAKFIIHTVGPVFGRANGREEELLADCYWNSLRLACEHSLKTIAFPCISTGIYRFPKKRAAETAVATARKFIKENPAALDKIRFITFGEEDYNIYKDLLQS